MDATRLAMLGAMPPPQRTAALGTEASVLDDLLLARDAVGLARCGADKLAGTLRLLFGGDSWEVAQVVAARQHLADQVQRTCSAFAVLHRGDPCAAAAATSLRDILLQPANGTVTAAALRDRARKHHECQLAADSLRKRELPILQNLARNAYQAAHTAHTTEEDLLPTKDSILQFLSPFAELSALSVTTATDLFAKRAALADEAKLYQAVAAAIWAVARLGVLPVYGLQRLQALGIRNITDQSIEYLLDGLIHVPFVVEPDDLNQLSTAIQMNESATEFYDRLYVTPVMRPVLERFVTWLASHDPKVCLYASNDVMIGYCGPHYYASLCESLVDAAENYASGELTRDFEEQLSAIVQSRRALRAHVRTDS
jgi:hypothetical protein